MKYISQLPRWAHIEFRGEGDGNSSCIVWCKWCRYACKKTTTIEISDKQKEILKLLNSLYTVEWKKGEYINLAYVFIGDIDKLTNDIVDKIREVNIIIKDTDIIWNVGKLVIKLEEIYKKMSYNKKINISLFWDIWHDEVLDFIDKLYNKIDYIDIRLWSQESPIDKEQLDKLFDYLCSKYTDIKYEVSWKKPALSVIFSFDEAKKSLVISKFSFFSFEERKEYKQKMYEAWMNNMIPQLVFSFLSGKIQLQHTFLTVNDKETFISEDEFYQVLSSLAEIKKDKISHIKTVEDILETYGGYMLEADRIALEEIINLNDNKYRKHIEENIWFYVVHILLKKYVSSKLAYNKWKLKLLTHKNGEWKESSFK